MKAHIGAAAATFVLLMVGHAIVTHAMQAPDAASLKAVVGREKKTHEQTNLVSPPLTTAEAQTLMAKIQAIRRLLLATPALQGLRGHDWATYGLVNGHAPGQPLKARLGYIAYPYFFNARMNRAESSAEGAPFSIHVNDPDCVLGNGTYLVDEEARFTFAPPDAGVLDGYRVYFPADRFVVITKDARPLYVPVTQQQYLDVRIAQSRKSFADMKASLAAVPDGPSKRTALSLQEDRVTALERELAALTVEQRSAAALDPDGMRTTRPSALADAGAARTRPIVMPNPALFDAKAPRTDVQMIVLGSIRYQPDLFGPLQAQIDKAALRKLLD